MTETTDAGPRRLSLLYQAWLLTQASREFMRLALAGTGMRGEEYGLYSYLFANGPRTLSQAARDLGQPVTTLAAVLNPLIEMGDIARRAHPRDRRAKLLELTDAGRARLEPIIPVFSAAYSTLLHELEARNADTEAMYTMLAELRAAVERTTELMSLETGSLAPPDP
jgi:DNA-binding MarR family transcriptional regulator